MTKMKLEKFPEVGGLLHMDHFNFGVTDHRIVTVFCLHGLGLTRDPFQRSHENNYGVNIGQEQFHCPLREDPMPPFIGEVGLVVPELVDLKQRLDELADKGRFEGTSYEILDQGKTFLLVRSPWDIVFRLHLAGSIPYLRPLGLPYVDIPVEPGKAEKLAKFYAGVTRAPCEMTEIDGEATLQVTVGRHQYFRFRERVLDNYALGRYHAAYYATNYNEVRDLILKFDLANGVAEKQVTFFEGPFDPETGELLLDMDQEIRSVYNRDFGRQLVNRWPIVTEPFLRDF